MTMVEDKKIVDQVSGWVTVFDDGSVDRTWTGPSEVKFMFDPVLPHDDFVDGIAVRDVITHHDLCKKVRIYLPQKSVEDLEKLPILLHFHGGGFCISEANWYMYYSIYSQIARTTRAIVVSPYLRRAPEHRLPAACDDGLDALIWLSSIAQGEAHEPWLNKHADFGRVFLIGDSSGGNIVHQVVVRAGNENLSPLKLVGAIPIHPGFVRSWRSKSELEQPESPFLTLEMVDKFLNMALPVGSNKDHPITCPMGEAAPPLEGLNLQPYLYCVADQDLLKDTEMEFYEAMKRAGKQVELLISHGVGHSFYLNKIAVDMDPITGKQTKELVEAITEFVRKH